MVRRGWPHGELMAMRESDFAFWLGEQIARDEAEAEAAKKVREG